MSAATLLELAERCEKATGSLGRDFDADVFEALGYEVKRGPSELVPEGWGYCVGDVHPPGECYLDTGRPCAAALRARAAMVKP